MTPREYMFVKKINQTDLAKILKRAPSTVSRLLKGETLPDWDTMITAMEETKGEIMPNDWLSVFKKK